ncbi:M20/M25/M40 family metallo-hydrolase [Pseudoduganella chitinolytica]|uniref:Carboxypeptidase Q n=1 Tax=Pseudoduganella chitinolytica TaxID=34070 RepID=A0ABY8BGC4_9BURK|nr:M20/M25/M40 family metallo-hydrolase [Pseudoduganella chitinolytica]WEF34981.1 M20/M25/M40 family metallo-hydrolase [Pseudoduganella chitinolytica]
MNLRKPARTAIAAASLFLLATAHAAPNDSATLAQVRDTAMASDWAYQRLEDMTDLIGPRLSGSAGAAAAVQQVADTMRKLGAKVTLQPVKVPHWVRGEEKAQLVEYAGRPQGIVQNVVLTALGGSGATPAAGLTAPVVIVHDFDELKARAAEVKGKIVLIDVPFDQGMAERGLAGNAYGRGSAARTRGPALAAELGAAAALVRSVGGADFRLTHTGMTRLKDDQRIPAAAITAEDAMLIGRLSKRGPVTMKLTLTPKTLPDADSYNVIADLPGTDKADEFVIVSGHLDSWDLATGAHDDATGVTASMGVIETLKKLKLQPRRTIRMVAWMAEENGGSGGRAYHQAHKAQLDKQFAAIESDGGVTGRTFGVVAGVRPQYEKLFAPLQASLTKIGAGALTRRDVLGEGDLHYMESDGVPSFAPHVDTSAYFNYHHTPADTFDKVNPDHLKRHVAVLSTLTWYLANMEEPIGRAPEQLN